MGQLLIGNTTSVFSQSTGLTWTTASNLLTATNLNITGNSTITGTSILTGNVGIGTSTSVANVLQVGAGGRLRIANNNTDYTAIGSTDTDGPLNTQIVISGSAITGGLAGNIQYVASSTGQHIFFTPSTLERMRITNDGSVLIGSSTNSSTDDNINFAIPDAQLYIRGGVTTGGTCNVVIRGGIAGQNTGKARLWLLGDSSHASYIQSEHTGSGNTQLTFGTANGNALPVEIMRIDNNGNVGIGTDNP